MKLIYHTLSTLVVAILLIAPQAQAEQYLLINATLIDPATETVTPNAWVHIADGKILATGNTPLPAVAEHIDLDGAFLLPGLIDAHLHLTAGPLTVDMKDGAPALSMVSHEAITRFHAAAALASGVTTAFSPAGDPIANHRYAKQQRSGELSGPALHYAGLFFDPTPIAGGSVYPGDADGWRAEIERQKALGVSHIKLYHGLSEAELRQGTTLAKAAGLKSIAHLDHVSWQFAADAGVDALTHAFMPSADLLPQAARAQFEADRTPGSSQYLYRWFEAVDYDAEPMQTLFRTLASKNIRVDLTLIATEMAFIQPKLDSFYPTSDWQIHPAAANWRQNIGMSVYNWTADDFQRAEAVYPKVLELVERMHEAGVPLLIGSDSYGAGDWFWRELQLHQRAGLDNWRILQMVTSDAARILQLGNIGRLKAGAQADLIAITQNPLDDIAALRSVNLVIQAGIRHSVAALRADLASAAQAHRISAQ
ncbi:amidohydrolase family protein [Simiduia agarivorans]|uniref:Amidohydrolase n=1 Tax=Simiduia agarivorans (strain DSM 21679 / JCM 13881 / BCRC 17597 / SA1) TaxID=1117647 RepID=K4KLM5_SIMAS|nr:amidohydrolase family protein [Simiduia agarivorans]AFU99125.1 amidohydrolase [Simiduia agarivorans SA1 = DSM 21679]